MASDKPQITATIKFRGVTIEDLTLQEMKELRDILNGFVGEKVTERVVERHHDHYPYYPSRPWYTGVTWTVSPSTSGDKLVLGQGSGGGVLTSQHYTVTQASALAR